MVSQPGDIDDTELRWFLSYKGTAVVFGVGSWWLG